MFRILARILIIISIIYLPSYSLAEKPTFEQILSAAEHGNANAQNELGIIYMSGKKGNDKAYEAFQWFEKSSNQGNFNATYNLAQLYLHGKGTLVDKKKAQQLFDKAADGGNASALYQRGETYQANMDMLLAEKYIRMAADKGNLQAQNHMSYFYEHGIVVPKDMKAMYEWHMKAAEKGLPVAEYNVGNDYLQGRGVEKNTETGVSWLKKASAANFLQAKTMLATLTYKNGDKDLALEKLRESAVSGDKKAQDLISSMYHTQDASLKIPKGQDEAFEWYNNRAQKGDRDAQYELGIMYIKMGNQKDGVKWIEAAAAQGQPYAIKNVDQNKNFYSNNRFIDSTNEAKQAQNLANRNSRLDFYNSAVSHGL